MTTKTLIAPLLSTESVEIDRQITVSTNATGTAIVDRYNGDTLVEHVSVPANYSITFGEYFSPMRLKITALTGIVTTVEAQSNSIVAYPIKSLLANVTGTGYLSGGIISINADTTKFDVSAGKLVFTDNFTDPSNPTVKLVSFLGESGISPSVDSGSHVICINSSGQLVQIVGSATSENRRDLALIGSVTTQGGNVIAVSNGKVRAFDLAGTAIDLVFALGVLNLSGNDYSANGANLKINRSAGSCFFFGNVGNDKDPNNKISTQSLADQFFTVYRNGTGGAVVSALTDTIETTKYDNGTGTLATLGNNKWGIRWITYIPPANLTRVAYGQVEYATMEAAIAGLITEAPVLTASNITSQGTQVRGAIIFKKGATDLSNPAQAVFRNGGTFGMLTNSGVSATALQNIQGVYDASVSPELVTDTTRGAFTVKRGSAADTDAIYEGLNSAGTVNFSVTGEGVAKATGVKFNTVLKTTTYAILSSDYTVRCDATGGIFNVTLPDATLYTGQVFIIKKIDAVANTVTVNTTSSQTIDGATTYSLSTQYQTVRVQSNGANWNII